MSRVTDLDRAIRALGVPIYGVSRLPGGAVRIDFNGATAQQMSDAQTLAAGWDWTPRRPRPLAAIRADIAALAAANKQALLEAVAAYLVQQVPDFMSRFGLAGAVAGDEPDI
jgi:hypothetical protein